MTCCSPSREADQNNIRLQLATAVFEHDRGKGPGKDAEKSFGRSHRRVSARDLKQRNSLPASLESSTFAKVPTGLISYSHDSPNHEERTLALCQRLRDEGVDAQIDQYVEGTPEEGWPRWMQNQLDRSEFVLVVCTETYYRRFRGLEEPGKGKGADWEGSLITAEIYQSKSQTKKFVPLVFDHRDVEFIPESLSIHTHYVLDSEAGYTSLYAFLTGQAGVKPQVLGSLVTIPQKRVAPLRFEIHNLPFPSNPLFTGRGTELETLRRYLSNNTATSMLLTLVVQGMGGVGKTQLAVQYAWKAIREFDALLWVRAESPEALESSLASLAPLLKLPEANLKEQSLQVQAVLMWLRDRNRWLIIADNVNTDVSSRAVREQLFAGMNGSVLITSRLQTWPPNIPSLSLDIFSHEEAVDYLLARCRDQNHHAGEKTDAQSLAKELGCLPLALEQAASFIAELRWSFGQYQTEFLKARTELLSEHREGSTNYPASVAETFSITTAQLSPLAHALLRIAAWLAPDIIPRNIFSANETALSEALNGQAIISPLSVQKALAELRRFSLIRLENESFSIHRLVQAVQQDSLTQEQRNQWLNSAVSTFNAFAPAFPEDPNTWGVWLPLSPHGEKLVEHTRQCEVETLPVARMMNQLGLFLKARANYAQAKAYMEAALKIRENLLGPEHSEVGLTLHNLAEISQDQGEFREAEILYQRALPILEKEPTNLLLVAAPLNGLAILYANRRDYAKAEPLFLRARSIWEEAPGPGQLDLARCLNNLADLYGDQARYAEAETLYKRALSIREQATGPERLEVANSLNNLATLYAKQGKYVEAEELIQRSRSIALKVLGADHPFAATGFQNIAAVYFGQGKFAEAEPLYRQALTIREKALGPEHIDLAITLYGLGLLYRCQGKYAEA